MATKPKLKPSTPPFGKWLSGSVQPPDKCLPHPVISEANPNVWTVCYWDPEAKMWTDIRYRTVLTALWWLRLPFKPKDKPTPKPKRKTGK